MDQPHLWMMDYAQDLLPEDSLQYLHHHLLYPEAPLQTLKNHLFLALSHAAAALEPLVTPLLDRLTAALHRSPDIVVLGFFLLLLLLAIQILSWIRRLVAFWARLVLRLLGWAALVAVLTVLYNRGIEATARDAARVAGAVAGYAAVVRDIWVREYRRYEAQAAEATQTVAAAAAKNRHYPR